MSLLLATRNVTVKFQARKGLLGTVTVRALDDVSMHLDRGETVALVGESGSGKTTLARVCLHLQEPNQGVVSFDGQDITHWTARRLQQFRRRAQGIFQDPFSSLDTNMTVEQIIEEPLVIHGLRDGLQDIVYKALEEVNLTPPEELAAKFPHMLSGGQRQRVAIARALVLQPDLVVADEPVSMVDASSRAEILYLLRKLQERHGTAFLYITHDIATAYHFSQRIAVMYLGRIVETGATREVIDNPLHPYTAALVKAVPEPDPNNRLKRRAMVEGEPPSPTHPPYGCHFHPRCPYAFGPCPTQAPPLVEVHPGHWVACHLWPERNTAARLPEKPQAG